MAQVTWAAPDVMAMFQALIDERAGVWPQVTTYATFYHSTHRFAPASAIVPTGEPREHEFYLQLSGHLDQSNASIQVILLCDRLGVVCELLRTPSAQSATSLIWQRPWPLDVTVTWTLPLVLSEPGVLREVDLATLRRLPNNQFAADVAGRADRLMLAHRPRPAHQMLVACHQSGLPLQRVVTFDNLGVGFMTLDERIAAVSRARWRPRDYALEREQLTGILRNRTRPPKARRRKR